ncbi:hypothetical protein ACWC5C_22155 [Streptomyces sp. NPDC001700]
MFRAHSLDVCASAEIPSIHAHWTGLDTKLVAAVFREDPLKHPVYELGIAPGADVDTLSDLRGKKIAYSPGQAQGALVLRIRTPTSTAKTAGRPSSTGCATIPRICGRRPSP